MRTFSAEFPPLSEAARKQSLQDTVAAHPDPGGDLWMFGYGGLMWRPDFDYAERRSVRLEGWKRRLCVWTILARGTPDYPGLSLGLRPGGHCDGIAYRLPEEGRLEILAEIWRREMWTDVYRPTWIDLETGPALTFTVNTSSLQYTGGMDDEVILDHIRSAAGRWGSCREYFDNTLQNLRTMGVTDSYLEALAEKLD